MENKITIIVVTTGEDLEEEFNIHQPLRVVLNRALALVQPGANPDLFHLSYNDQPLDISRKIEDYIEELGWTDGVTLELVGQPEVI